MRILVFSLIVFSSSLGFGLEGLNNNWCMYHETMGRITHRLEIAENGDYKRYEESGPDLSLSLTAQGYISQGAATGHMTNDMGERPLFIEAVIRYLNDDSKRLVLFYMDKSEVFDECRN